MLELAGRLNLTVTLGASVGEREARLFLQKKRGESMAHVVMKLLAWAVYAGDAPDGLKIEAPAGQHYKPDVVRFGDDGQPRLWIDCGRTAPKKLAEVVAKNRRATVVIVKRAAAELAHYRLTALPRLRRLEVAERVAWLAFDDGFVERVAERLWGRHALAFELGTERLALQVDDGPREATALVYLS